MATFLLNVLMQPANGLRPTCGQAGRKECTQIVL